MKKVLGLLLVAIIVLAGCGASSDPLVLRRATVEVEGLDVTQASYSQTFDLYEAIYEGLYVVNPEGEIVPAGASELPTISDDGLTYTFKLNEDAVWVDSNGDVKGNVTAYDYEFSWKRMVDPQSGASYSYIFEVLDGYEEAAAGDLDKLGVKALDDYTLEVKLAYPAPYFTSMLAFGAFAPVSKECVLAAEEAGKTYAATEDLVWYNGPFYVQDYNKTGTIKTVKNENYWDVENVALNGIDYVFMKDMNTQFTAYQAGEVDIAQIPSQEQYEIAQANFPEALQLREEAGTMVFYFNTQDGDMANANLRKAVQYSINTQEIADVIYGTGTKPATNLVPGELTESSYGVNFDDLTGDLVTYNPELAKQYLALAEQELGKKASEINITLLIASGDVNKTLAEYIQSQLTSTLGITVTIEQLDQSAYSAKRDAGDFDMVYGGWSADYADAGNFLGLYQSSAIGGLNTPRYNNPAYDEAFQAANQEADPVKRNQMFAELEKQIIQEDAILVPITKRGKDILVNPNFNFYTNSVFKVSSKYITVNE